MSVTLLLYNMKEGTHRKYTNIYLEIFCIYVYIICYSPIVDKQTCSLFWVHYNWSDLFAHKQPTQYVHERMKSTLEV